MLENTRHPLLSFFPIDAQVRTVLIDDQPWFVATDVCRCLGLGLPANHTRKIDKEDKQTYPVHTQGGVQNLLILSEPALYRLTFRSRKPEARRFTNWVCKEVLPSIRKDGFFTSAPVDYTVSDDELLAQATELLAVKVARLQKEKEKAAMLDSVVSEQ